MLQDRTLTTKREASRRRPDDPDRHYMIYCDESGLHGSKLIGFGTLWMTYERRGDFTAIIDELSWQHFPPIEIKWERVKRRTYPFFAALVDEFFACNWLMFHCLLISKQEVDLRMHDNDWDLARRKHFTLLLASKIKRFATEKKHYLIRVDPIPSSYGKADEACEAILRNIAEQAPSLRGSDDATSW